MAHKIRRVPTTVVASALSLLFSAAAHGAFYPAHFDPAGTGSVPGFIGDAVFDISDGCLDVDGWKPTTGVTGGCSASLLSATVYLYSLSSGEPVPGAHIDQFSFSGSFPVLGVTSLGGQPKEVDTDPEPDSGVPGEGFYSDHLFWLQFVSGQCPTSICAPIPPGGSSDLLSSAKAPGDPAYIFMDFVDLEHRSNPANVIFGPACRDPSPTACVVVPVPEPGVLDLILAALGATWLTRRRKPRVEKTPAA